MLFVCYSHQISSITSYTQRIKNGHKNVGGSSMAISLDLLNNIDINYETNNFFLQKLYINPTVERDIIHVCVINYIHNSILK